MNKLRDIIALGEGFTTEFKACRSALNRDVYKTVCAFLNRHGGALLLGVDDSGCVTGVDPAAISRIRRDFANALNNPQKISPPAYLSIEEIEADGETVLHVYVPESSQVHRCNGRIYDRNEDGDFVDVNLVESYDRIMAFVAKHLPDPFYLEGTTSISLRDAIFREVASNILIHREYMNAFPAKLVIERGQVRTENSNKPHGFGVLNPETFTPFPKNPVIASFFRQIGQADELGSGMRNLMKYGKAYGAADPELVEGDIFRIVVKTPEKESEEMSGKTSGKILKNVGENNRITISELAEMMGITERSVERAIRKLQNTGQLKRVGPAKGGYWEILK